ncbi:MAG: hypothetical protein WBC18_06165 [Ottowia sp.]|uniref:hypothetical protein n=1 Tax=unclassified Ottowia TaxID=2645081 RepID=UPI003C2BE4B6
MSAVALSPVTIGGAQSAAPSNFDLETAILSVTLDRIALFDGQIADLMQKMKDRNDKAAKYNAVNQVLNKIKNAFANDAKGQDTIDGKKGGNAKDYQTELTEACKAAGIDIAIERDGKAIDFKDFKLSDIENLISKTQGLVDENNNTSQMDQLQLQSLISKRNAQFEMASTVMKKIIDSIMAIISNMR